MRRLLRLHHAVEDVLHLARQDHVLHAHAEHLDAELADAAAHVTEDVGVERGLVAEQLVQRLRGDRLAQAELQLAVHVVAELRDLGARGHRVGDADAGGQVDAQADLVAGQQLLARHLQRLHAQLDHVDRHVLAEIPERVAARLEHLHQLAVDEHQARRLRRHFGDDRELAQRAELAQAVGDIAAHPQAIGQRHALHLDLDQTTPVQPARTRCQYILELAVLRHQADFVSADVGEHERLAQPLAEAHDQCIHVVACVFRCGDVVRAHLDALERIGNAMHARRQHALELAVAVQHGALAVADHDPLGPEHGNSPCWSWWSDPIEARWIGSRVLIAPLPSGEGLG